MVLERTRDDREMRLHPESTHVFDLAATTYTLRQEPEYAANGRTGITLVKNPQQRIVLEVLRHGTGMGRHRAPGPISVQVLEGEIRFEADNEVFYLRKGELVELPAHRPHAVEAVHDAAMLLTITPETRRERALQ